eukprot:2536624-Rhodomonas_salina.2
MGGEEARNDAGSKELWKSFIDMHEDLELLESGKCRCKVTGHEMKPLKDVVEVSAGVRGRELAHLNGKRYKKEKAKRAAEKYDFEKYAPDIVQSRKDPRKLFCHLTKTVLNKVPEELELHVNGRRFKLRKQEREHNDALRAARKKKQPAEDDGEEDPILKQFEGFDSADDEAGNEKDNDEFEEGAEEKPSHKGKKKQLMPAIGAVEDDSGDDFEEVVAADSDDDDDDDDDDKEEEEEEEAPKEKLPWPVP